MTTILFSDPHIGVDRRANTTPESRGVIKRRVAEAVRNIVASKKQGDLLVCGGDFFDTYSNDEMDILEGYTLMQGVDYVLAGNHDVANSSDKFGSLQFCHELFVANELKSPVMLAEFGVPSVVTAQTDFGHLVFVPHAITQDLFVKSLIEAKDAVGKMKGKKVLVLHCNYCAPFTNEITLNLTEEMAADLLQVFNLVFIGHEHQPAEHFGGRLVVMGNTFPTAFGDISDKFIYKLDKNCVVTKEKIWSANTGFASITLEEGGISEEVIEKVEGVDLIRVQGKVAPHEMVPAMRAIRDMWKRTGALAVKVDLEMIHPLANVGEVDSSEAAITKLKDLIYRELEKKDKELADLFLSYADSVED